PALLRPGRVDRQVIVPNPDVVGREQILKVHVRKVPLAPDVNLKTTARGTPGFSGADLMNLVNEAALMAARRNKRMVTQVEFEDAKDKVMMGAERKSLVMTEEEKLLTAYHEGGHAIVALNVQATDPARMMVTRWGLSETLGTVAYGENQDEVFLGYQVARQQNVSEETSRKIDGEIKRLVEAGYAEAQHILEEKRADLETLAKG